VLEKIIAVITAIAGQLPWVVTITGAYPLSLYQPSIYRGKELFLIVPAMIAIAATWAVLTYPRRAMWIIFVIFLFVVALVYWMYQGLPTTSPFHFVNWILFYCAFALLFAALTRFIVDFLPKTP
jgi:hypothetical protein